MYHLQAIPAWRELLARLSLAAAMLLPLITTIWLSSGWVNLVGAACLCAFTLALLPEVAQELRRYRHTSMLVKVSMVLIAASVVGWLFHYVPIFGLYRTWIYLVIPFFFLAMTAWLRRGRDERCEFIYVVKLLSTLFALAWIAGYLLLPSTSDEVKLKIALDPPIFRNLRHLNYELALVMPLLLHFWLHGRYRQGGFFLLMVIGYFSIWSAGRGQALALVVFFALVLGARALPIFDLRLWQAGLAFTLGGVFVYILGESYLINRAVAKTMGADTVEHLSSGRIGIWKHTLEAVWKHEALMFGMGPDATLRLGVISDYVHPHNSVVQFIAEFGIVGTTAIVLLIGKIGFIGVKQLRAEGGLTLAKTISALFLSTLVFSLVDGQFYHILPLTIIVIMVAYLCLQPSTSPATKSISGSVQTRLPI